MQASGCVLWGPAAAGIVQLSDQGVSLRRTATDRVSYEGRNKERSTMRERRKCRTRRERPIDGSRKTKKKKKKNRVGLKVRDRRERKTKGWKYQFARRNYLRKVRLRKEKRIRSMPENIISRYCHHRAPFLSAREREEEENRGGERERERKKKESSCFVLHIIHWGNDLVHARYQPTRSAPLNGTIRRANTFGQVGAFMNKTWPPSHVRHRPLQFHTGHGQDRDPAALYWALDRFSYLRHSIRTSITR